MIAIHHTPSSFSDKWIEYCEKKNIEYKIVDCYSTDIIKEVSNCSALLWHWYHKDEKAMLYAKGLMICVEKLGIKVFPDINTCWHFDDKIGQKYLLEAIDAPFVSTFVFYSLPAALNWIDSTDFPKVFKLSGGAGAENVSIINNKKEAIKLAKKAFKTGIKFNRFSNFFDKVTLFRKNKSLKNLLNIAKGFYRIFFIHKNNKNLPIHKNYFYAQEFILGNDCDIRVIVIGERAFAIKRMVRKGDFRASGSGDIKYSPEEIPQECLRVAFEVNKTLQSQCTAFDFVFKENNPLIIEISYGFSQQGYLDCQGYWDKDLNWIPEKFHPEYFIMQDIIGNE